MTVRAIVEITGIWTLVIGSLVEWLPTIAAGLAAVWTIILIGAWLGLWKRPSR